jgi:hypothetical protein
MKNVSEKKKLVLFSIQYAFTFALKDRIFIQIDHQDQSLNVCKNNAGKSVSDNL